MSKKPDRFEQMAEREYKKWLNGDMSQRGWLQVAERCMALQYAAYVRLVKRQPHYGDKVLGRIDRSELLAALARYKKGTP